MSERRRKTKLVPRTENVENEKFVEMKALVYSNMSKRKKAIESLKTDEVDQSSADKFGTLVYSNMAKRKKAIESLKTGEVDQSSADKFGVGETTITTVEMEYNTEEGNCLEQNLIKRTTLSDMLEFEEAADNRSDKAKVAVPITFRVNVEVEAFDESDAQKNIKVEIINCNNDVDIPDESNEESTSIQETTVNETEGTEINVNEECNNEGNDNTLNNGDSMHHESSSATIMQCKIIEESVYNELERLSKTTLSATDRRLLAESRNSWGRISNKIHTETKQECKIQLAINNWKSWVALSKLRDTPLMYKCYICTKAWWRLGPFMEHAKMHEQDNFWCYIETQFHQCNLIACDGEKLPPKDIPIESDCWKCGRDYAFHKESFELLTKIGFGFSYQCKYCYEKFFTCTSLNNHYCFCMAYKKFLVQNKTDKSELKFYSCHICKLIVTYKVDLQKHYTNFHTVPSDLPMLLPVKVCMYCNQYHVLNGFHACPKKKLNQWCMSCNKRFSSVIIKNIHMYANKGSIKCKICKERLNSKCGELNHIVRHSKIFVLVYKCAKCDDDWFLMDSSSRRHHHGLWQSYDGSKHFAEAVILPRKCVSSEMTEETKWVITNKKKYKVITTDQTNLNQKSYKKEKKITKKVGNTNKEHSVSAKIHADDSQKEILNNIKQEKVSIEDVTVNTATEEHGDNAIERFNKTVNENVNEGVNESVRIKVETNIDDPEVYDEHNYAIDVKQEIDFECTKTNVNHPIKEEPVAYEDLLSKVFGSPQNFATTSATIIKEEPIDEEIFEDDIIVLTDNNHSDGSVVTTIDVDTVGIKADFDAESQEDATTVENQEGIEPDCVEGYDNDDDDQYDTGEQSVEYSYNGLVLNLDNSEPDRLIVDLNREDWEPEQADFSLQPSTSKQKDGNKKKCNRCYMTGSRKEYNQHLTRCLYPYKCTKCDQNFKSLNAYVWHFQTHGYAVNTCPLCDMSYSATALLISHIKMHIKSSFRKESVLNSNAKKSKMNVEIKYVCTLCLKTVDVELLFVHWESHMDINLSINNIEVKEEDVGDREAVDGCLDADVVKNIKKILLLKKDYLINKQRICIVCNRDFHRKNDFKRHLIEHLLSDAFSRHSLYSALKCQFCDYNVYKIDKFRQHMRDHACLPVYRCELCLKSFSDSSNFAKHKKTHDVGTTLPQCDICKKKFHSKVMIIKHIKMHEETKPIDCACCRKTFFDASAYRRHRRNVEFNKSASRFPCQICKRKFSSLKDNWDHMWEVHKQRKYIADCPICHKPFRKFLDVKAHIKTDHKKDVSLLRASIFKSLFGSPDGPKAKNSAKNDANEMMIVYDNT